MIGFTSTSLRKYSVEEIADIAAKAGADVIEWGSDCHILNAGDAAKAKKLCSERGIIINSYGTYYRIGSGKTDEWRGLCESAAVMDAKYMRTWLGTKGSKVTDEKEFEKILADARVTADIAAEYGLTVCNECHPNTFNDTTASSLRFLDEVGRENIKTYYQSWYRDEESDKEKLFATIGRVQDVHISFSELEHFQRFHKKDPEFINKITAWLKELDFSNALLIEFTKHGTAEELINDVERLRKLWET